MRKILITSFTKKRATWFQIIFKTLSHLHKIFTCKIDSAHKNNFVCLYIAIIHWQDFVKIINLEKPSYEENSASSHFTFKMESCILYNIH
jgi:hypothetical protein